MAGGMAVPGESPYTNTPACISLSSNHFAYIKEALYETAAASMSWLVLTCNSAVAKLLRTCALSLGQMLMLLVVDSSWGVCSVSENQHIVYCCRRYGGGGFCVGVCFGK